MAVILPPFLSVLLVHLVCAAAASMHGISMSMASTSRSVALLNVPMVPHTAGKRKIIHLIRHGQTDDSAEADLPLSQTGIEQCEELRRVAPTTLEDVELVVCSPLSCALQSACKIFEEQLEAGVPVVALEDARETILSAADMRSTTSKLAAEFDQVSFDELQEEEDALWREYAEMHVSEEACAGARELSDLAGLRARCARLVRWLLDRQERESEVAVVSHSSLLFHLLNFGFEPLELPSVESRLAPYLLPPPEAHTYAEPAHAQTLVDLEPVVSYGSPPLMRLMREPFTHCEVRTVVLSQSSE